VVAAVLALAGAGGAWADDREQVHFAAADQTLAKVAVVQRADLGDPAGWTGGPSKPSPPSSFTCGSYHAKQSDLVLTGSAATKWTHAGLEFDSEAQVLKTERMVRLDWQRTVTHPGVADCLRKQFAAGLAPTQRLVSFQSTPFPKVATFTAAFRGVIEVAGKGKARVIVDVVVFGTGRVELTLITTAPYSARGPVAAAEGRLAQLMVVRARPGAA
jgi:hypothetical protein